LFAGRGRRNVGAVFGDARRVVIVGAVVLFALGLLLGFLIGRSASDEEPAASASATAVSSPSPTAAATGTGQPVVVTPSPGEAPAITNEGQILQEGDRPVVTGTAASTCESLVSPGSIPECGDVPVAGGRVVWMVQRSPTTGGATAIQVRLMTFVPDSGGWVEWLQAEDATGERWSDVNVLPADLTGDGVAELLVGFRGVDERETLEYDVVGYDEAGLPEVLAHPTPAARGAVVVSSGQVQEYGAQFPNDEPACCPPSYLLRTIAFEDAFFRVTATEAVAPNLVPASQL
jgi:hypothetical protein